MHSDRSSARWLKDLVETVSVDRLDSGGTFNVPSWRSAGTPLAQTAIGDISSWHDKVEQDVKLEGRFRAANFNRVDDYGPKC